MKKLSLFLMLSVGLATISPTLNAAQTQQVSPSLKSALYAKFILKQPLTPQQKAILNKASKRAIAAGLAALGIATAAAITSAISEKTIPVLGNSYYIKTMLKSNDGQRTENAPILVKVNSVTRHGRFDFTVTYSIDQTSPMGSYNQLVSTSANRSQWIKMRTEAMKQNIPYGDFLGID